MNISKVASNIKVTVAVLKEFRSAVMTEMYGEKADIVKFVNDSASAIAFCQLVSDINRGDMNKLVINQIGAGVALATYNYYMHKKCIKVMEEPEVLPEKNTDGFVIKEATVLETKANFISRVRREHLAYIDHIIAKYPLRDTGATELHEQLVTDSCTVMNAAIAAHPEYL